MKDLRLSTVRFVTGDMISPPLSPTSDLNFDTTNPAVRSALEYVSQKLQRKGYHATFIIFRDKPLPIGHGYKLDIHPISPLDEPVRRSFNHWVGRAAKKFGLRQDWIRRQSSRHNAAAQNTPNWEYVVQRSVVQNSVLFGQEGLTLLNVDRILTLKQQLSALSNGQTAGIPENIYTDSCTWLLRQIMKETDCRPFTKGFFHCAYDHLQVRDDLLVNLAREYAAKHDHQAIILPTPKARTKKTDDQVRFRHHRRGGWAAASRSAGVKRQLSGARVGPQTPHSPSDVTPITRNEWKLLMHKALGGIKIVPVQAA